MTSSTVSLIEDQNDRMDPAHPRADGPRRRRVFSASDKLAHLNAYEQACQHGEGGAYLRREGLYSSLISEWRKQRDAGVLAGKQPGQKVGRLTAEQAEIARLTTELARANKRLTTTEAALDIMGKAHALLESLSERADAEHKPSKRSPKRSLH
jgi:transposase